MFTSLGENSQASEIEKTGVKGICDVRLLKECIRWVERCATVWSSICGTHSSNTIVGIFHSIRVINLHIHFCNQPPRPSLLQKRSQTNILHVAKNPDIHHRKL